jgi:ABC-type glycerol-3-phosphate transport system permease component
MESTRTLAGVEPQATVYVPRRRRWHSRTILLHAILLAFCAIILIPLLWVVLRSISSIPDAYSGRLIPQVLDFTHYSYVFEHIPTFLQNYTNSVIVTLSTVVITSIIAILAGYALVHLKLPWGWALVAVLVGTLFFPTRIVSIIGIYNIQDRLHLLNSLIGLILPYVTLNLAVSILIMRGVFETISHEMVEAAKMDGASAMRILLQIMLPLVANGIVVLVIVNFVTAWGEYLLAVTLIDDQSVRTMPVVLATTFGGFGEWQWPRISAVYMLAILPGIIAFAVAQRWYMKGLQEGALKF